MVHEPRQKIMKQLESADNVETAIEWRRELAIESDLAFVAAMDFAIAAGLEHCSTSIDTTPGTRKPRFISGHEFD